MTNVLPLNVLEGAKIFDPVLITASIGSTFSKGRIDLARFKASTLKQ